MVKHFLIAAILFAWPLLTFSQMLEFSNVTRLPAIVNSNADEGMPLLTPDGKKLFFTRASSDENKGGLYAGQDIWAIDVKEINKKKADNSFSFNNKNNNVAVGFNADNKTLYLVDASAHHKMNGIYFTRKVNNSWSSPELIMIPGIDNLDYIGFFVSPDFDVIFLSMQAPDSHGNEDLYYSIKDESGAWTKPRNLGATVNSTGYEISPFLAADKKRLYFASSSHGSMGEADIFYTEKIYDSWETWSVPVNLGPGINTKNFDAYFSIYGDTLAYFASNRDGKSSDLYSAKVSRSKTILAEGQHYLSEEELNNVVGKNVSTSITFSNKTSALSASQQELIFYIVNKLMLEKDIRFHLVAKEEEDPELTKARLQTIYNQMKQFGIDPTRIIPDQISSIKKSDRGSIEIMLFQ